jgi:hypothetical protein
MKKEIKKETISRLIRYLLMIAIVWGVSTGATAAGKLQLSSREFKVGTVTEGITIEKRVALENTGNKAMVIKNISTS